PAVRDRMSGPLCDAVLDRTGSSAVLAGLEGSNLLLVPLDRQRRWYRYHHLFHELLTAELGRREPELIPELHRRAASWCEANGLPESAIDHAQAAGDTDRVARLVWTLALPAYGTGRVDPPRRWFTWFEDQGLLGRYRSVAVLGAWLQALVGEPVAAERWADAAEHGPDAGTLPDGSPGRRHPAPPAGVTGGCGGGCGAATGWTGGGPTPRPPWPSSGRAASGDPRLSCWRGFAICWRGRGDRASGVARPR